MTQRDAGYDALVQRLAIALRDHADAVRALPDVEAMRARLAALVEDAAEPGPDAGTSGSGASGNRRAAPRHVVALACSALFLGGAGLAFAAGDAPPDEPVAAAAVGEQRTDARAAVGVGSGSGNEVSSVAAPRPSDTSPLPSAPLTTDGVPPPEARPVAGADDRGTGGNELAPVPPTAPPVTTTKAPTTTKVPTTTKPVATTTTLVRFTMVQKWKTSSATPPFEELSGTADPGTTITVTSAYGSGTTTVDPAGKWAIRVEFPTAPVGTAFTGRVRTATQGSKAFTFTRLPATS